ncbi:MAG TPA: ester cyclase [Solirubrobacteraceae bacterium]|nr:ester cyclase [Solirubrobacteraceae bacterium]
MATDVDQTSEITRVAREYFEALGRAERDAQQRYYAPDARAHIHGVLGPAGRDELAGFFGELFDAFPDWRFAVLDTVAEGDGVAVRWRARATFAGPGRFMGFEPNGARVDLEGVDLIRVRDGRISAIDAFMNGAELARQLGALPPQGSATEERMAKAFNLRTRVRRRLASEAEPVADGVWVVRGGFPTKEMSVYLVRDGDGVMLFDAGIKAMTDAVAAAGASLGGITRVLLGHGHPDHRGVAPFLDVPVLCHADNRADAEGDGGRHYFDYTKLKAYAKPVFPFLLNVWDGGPVAIAGTVSEGDDVAGFEVVLLPGHAPGLIGLWRAADRLALVSDCFYTLDPQTGRHGHPRVPHDAFNHDTEQARAAIRKLAAMEPAAAWAGHAQPLTGDVRGQLEHATQTT